MTTRWVHRGLTGLDPLVTWLPSAPHALTGDSDVAAAPIWCLMWSLECLDILLSQWLQFPLGNG